MCNRKVYLHSTELFIHRYFISIFSLTVMYGLCTYSFYDKRVGTRSPGLLGRHGVTPCWHTDWLHPLHLLNNTLYCFIIVRVDANLTKCRLSPFIATNSFPRNCLPLWRILFNRAPNGLASFFGNLFNLLIHSFREPWFHIYYKI